MHFCCCTNACKSCGMCCAEGHSPYCPRMHPIQPSRTLPWTLPFYPPLTPYNPYPHRPFFDPHIVY